MPANTLANLFPTGLIAPPGASQGLLTQRGQNLTFNLPGRRIPYVQQFSFGVQRELPWSIKLDASYVGSRARSLMTNEYNAGNSRGINTNTVEQLARARQDSRWYTQAVAKQQYACWLDAVCTLQPVDPCYIKPSVMALLTGMAGMQGQTNIITIHTTQP